MTSEKTVNLEDVTCEQLWCRSYQHCVLTDDVRTSPLDYAEHDLVTTEPNNNWVVMPDADDYLERADEIIYENVRIDDSGDFYRYRPGAKEALQKALDTWASDYLQQDTIHIATDVEVTFAEANRGIDVRWLTAYPDNMCVSVFVTASKTGIAGARAVPLSVSEVMEGHPARDRTYRAHLYPDAIRAFSRVPGVTAIRPQVDREVSKVF